MSFIEYQTHVQREFLQLSVVLDLGNVVNRKTDHQVHDDDRHDEDKGEEDEGRVGGEGDHLGGLEVRCLGVFRVVVLGEDSLELVFADHHHHRLQHGIGSRVKCHLEGKIMKSLFEVP